MPEFPSQPFTAVYIIYSADVVSESTHDMERMSPAMHMPTGRRDGTAYPAAPYAAVAAKFVQTEGDEQYDFGYLGTESSYHQVKFFPYGCLDSEGLDEPDEDYDGPVGQGQHRKWAAELTRDEWLLFAGAYCIGLDEHGYPEDYEETLGSLTEYGHLEAVCVDNRESWNDFSGDPVLDSQIYVSFGYASDPSAEPEPDDAADIARMEIDGAGLYAAGI